MQAEPVVPFRLRLPAFDGWHLAWAAWWIILLILSVRLGLAPRHNSTFPIFMRGASKWVRQGSLYHPEPGEDTHPYRYTPAATLLLVPFTALPLRAGAVCWMLLNSAVFLGGLVWWARATLPLPLTPSHQGILLLLVIPLSVGTLNNAQSNALIIGCLLAATACVAEQRWTLATLLIGVATIFKVYPLALGLLFLVLWPRQLWWRLPLILLTLLALPFLFNNTGWVQQQYVDWLHSVDDRRMAPYSVCYRDCWYLCRLWHLPVTLTAYMGLQLLAAAGVAGLTLWARRWSAGRSDREVLPYVLTLALCWMMLFGPSTESCTYIFLAPVLAWYGVRCWLDSTSRGVRGLLGVSSLLFFATAISCWFPNGVYFHMLGPHPVAALLFTVAVLALGTRCTNHTEQTRPISLRAAA